MLSVVVPIDLLLADYLALRDRFVEQVLLENASSCDEWTERRRERDRLNREDGCGYNPLHFVSIPEVELSRIIGDWLNPHGSHGQGRLFLDSLMDFLGVPHSSKDQWTVSIETGRIDILLKRRSPPGVIVLENKCNDAIDQAQQLYRYWYREIYLPFPQRNGDPVSSAFRIVYLTGNGAKWPVQDTLRRPDGFPSTLPDQLPLVPSIVRLADLGRYWSENAVPRIPSSNYRLRTSLQFIFEQWN